MLKGNDLVVWKNGTAIALAKSCEITLDTDVIEKSSPSSGKARAYVAGRTGWKVSTSCLLTNVKAFALANGTSVTLSFGSRDLNSDRLTGEAIVTDVKLTGTRGNLSSGSISFIGNGALRE